MENVEKNKELNDPKKYEVDENGFVKFNDVARMGLDQQSQYASRYVNGEMEGYPNLGKDLKFEGDPTDYHSLRIHEDDIEVFIARVIAHKKSSGNPFI